jgi:hypothetical protein
MTIIAYYYVFVVVVEFRMAMRSLKGQEIAGNGKEVHATAIYYSITVVSMIL